MNDYPDNRTPDWYLDAKLGIFVHWGIYSVPGWAPTGASFGDALGDFARLPYAEWYANSLRLPDSPTRHHHDQRYGAGVGYEDLADEFRAEHFDPGEWVRLFRDAGAKYVVPTSKHADGFALWDTSSTGFTAVRRGPKRDLIGALETSVRAAGLRFGLYYSGLVDWHTRPLSPVRSVQDVAQADPERTAHDPAHAEYARSQLAELIERFRPDVLWNDMGWPKAGHKDLGALLERYYETVPDGVVNDRLGVAHYGFRTVEYGIGERPRTGAWESTRGLGSSFGYNGAETDADLISVADLVRSFVDIVAGGGNLLLNVGPRGDGTIPDIQRSRLTGLGDWLAVNGDAIYGTRPWQRPADDLGGTPVRYTTSGDRLNVIVLGRPPEQLRLAPDVAALARSAQVLGFGEVDLAEGAIRIPATKEPASVVSLTIGGAA
ncbi:alpha-L-fucosidase [Kribbella sp. NPDC051586]|uniref:alpha-L-fucosidase n=1 Tax=Kribbella sp. NPDC051586 TaxID=3364118 RepID=UPI00378E91B3